MNIRVFSCIKSAEGPEKIDQSWGGLTFGFDELFQQIFIHHLVPLREIWPRGQSSLLVQFKLLDKFTVRHIFEGFSRKKFS